MRTFQRTLLAGAVALAVSAPATAQFSNMYFFGDSSTDAGFYGSRFTVNPGLIWAQNLGAAYGLTITTVAKGGTDFAQGGTNINSPSLIVPTISPTAPDRPLSTQITELLKISPSLDSNALYGVNAGYNDIFNNLTAAGAGLIPASQIPDEHRTGGDPTRTAGRASQRRRREIYRRVQPVRPRQIPGRHGESCVAVHLARRAVQYDADWRLEPGSVPDDPRQLGAAVQ